MPEAPATCAPLASTRRRTVSPEHEMIASSPLQELTLTRVPPHWKLWQIGVLGAIAFSVLAMEN